MIWLTWRQFRVQALSMLVLLAGLAVALAATGPNLYDRYRDGGLAACTADCGDLADAFLARAIGGSNRSLYGAGLAVMALLPALLGIFWGAPLIARELESGTHRLVWTQTVSRTRWLAVKVGLIGAVAVAAAALFGLAVTWWSAPIDDAYGNRMFPEVFTTRGVVPAAYAAFAFVAGVTAGMLIRRTVPAMAVTLVVVAALMGTMPFTVRPQLTTPVAMDEALDTSRIKSIALGDDGRLTVEASVRATGAWVLRNDTVTPDGRLFQGDASVEACGPAAGMEDCQRHLSTLNLRQQAEYVPAERFWTLQWREAAVVLGLTALLTGFAFWWLRRRTT
jgi:hypothetical protein